MQELLSHNFPSTQARSTISPPGKEDHYYNHHGRLISHVFREGKICEISQQKIATARDFGSRVLFFENSTTAEKPQTSYSFFLFRVRAERKWMMNHENFKFGGGKRKGKNVLVFPYCLSVKKMNFFLILLRFFFPRNWFFLRQLRRYFVFFGGGDYPKKLVAFRRSHVMGRWRKNAWF